MPDTAPLDRLEEARLGLDALALLVAEADNPDFVQDGIAVLLGLLGQQIASAARELRA